MASSLPCTFHQYGTDNDLQRVGVWKVDGAESHDSKKYWVIFIHGGAWFDPRTTLETFIPTIDSLVSASLDKVKSSVAAFASLDYRLSPHADHPQDAEKTPKSQLRQASHPDHIKDVRSALGFLQKKYGFGSNYVLIGHSAGATLALQLLMGSAALNGDQVLPGVSLPTAVVALEGIYDLTGLADRFGKFYRDFITAAFGESSKWNAAAPMTFTGGYKSSWEVGKLIILGWSPEDELIDEPEIDGMAKVLVHDKVNTLVIKDLTGTHDSMWEDGKPVAQMILKALEEIGA